MPISKRITDYLKKGSWIRKLFVEGAQMMNDGTGLPVYDFSIGNPDLDPPAEFKNALREIIEDTTHGQHKYMANVGYLFTRQAVAESLVKDYDLGKIFAIRSKTNKNPFGYAKKRWIRGIENRFGIQTLPRAQQTKQRNKRRQTIFLYERLSGSKRQKTPGIT